MAPHREVVTVKGLRKKGQGAPATWLLEMEFSLLTEPEEIKELQVTLPFAMIGIYRNWWGFAGGLLM